MTTTIKPIRRWRAYVESPLGRIELGEHVGDDPNRIRAELEAEYGWRGERVAVVPVDTTVKRTSDKE